MGDTFSQEEDDSKDRVGTFSHDVEPWELKPGDHVYCYPKVSLKKRHGIYIGDKKVIYYANAEDDSTEVATVCSCTLDKFTGGSKVRLAPYDSSATATLLKASGTTYWVPCQPANQVIKTAQYYVRNPHEWVSFNLKNNYSESFAYFCKTGRYQSIWSEVSDLFDGKTTLYYCDEDEDDEDDDDKSEEIDRNSFEDEDDDSDGRAGKIFHDIEKWELKPGDHIYSYRKGIFYSHHGIYIGEEGMEVIHFSNVQGKNKSSAIVCSCTLEEFADGGKIRLVAYNVHPVKKKFKRSESSHIRKSKPASKVIKTAKHYYDNPWEWKAYSLHGNNCESFAVFCKTGKRFSSQITQFSRGDLT